MQPTFEALPGVLLDASVRSLLLAAVVGLALLALRVRNRNLHHRAWTAVLLAMLGMPLLHAALPALAVRVPTAPPIANARATDPAPEARTAPPVPRESAAVAPTLSQPAASSRTPTERRVVPVVTVQSAPAAEEPIAAGGAPLTTKGVIQFLTCVYGVGVVVGMTRLARGVWRVHRLVLESDPADPPGAGDVVVRESSRVNVPIVVGVWRPVILLPSDWPTWDAGTLASVLEHERTHISRRDYSIGLLAGVNRCLYWFHPLAWWLRTKLPKLAEEVCDDLVITRLNDRATYAESLIAFAARVQHDRRAETLLGVAMARTTQLESRIDAILNAARPHAKRLRPAIVVAFLAILLPVTALVAAVHAERDSTPAENATPAEATRPDGESDKVTPADQLSKTIRVVDANSDPVEGAVVTFFGIQANGSGYVWPGDDNQPSEPPVVRTDERGVAIVSFPRYVNSQEKILSERINCRVEHSHYATSGYNYVPVSGDMSERITTLRIDRGAMVEVEAVYKGKKLPARNLYSLTSDNGSGGKLILDDGGRATLQRISPGPCLVRLVYLPDDGAPLFSDLKQLAAANGDEIKLSFNMSPGVSVEGAIDASVPRPVQRGRIISQVIDVVQLEEIVATDAGNGFDNPLTVTWSVNTEIRPDGTFVLEGVPPGDLQVTAICEGFRAAAPAEAPDFARAATLDAGRPQVFSVDQPKNRINVAMTPTAACKIIVVGPDKQRLTGAWVGFFPNVQWWGWGSQIYGHSLFSTTEYLRDPDRAKQRLKERPDLPYSGETDAQGVAILGSLPVGQNMLFVSHDDYELPLGEASGAANYRYKLVELEEGETTEVVVGLQPKGTEFVGEQRANQMVLGGCIPSPGHRIHLPKPRSPKAFPTEAGDTELAGVVVDEQGNPLSGVLVNAWSWAPGHEMTTGDDGRFVLGGFEHEEAVEVLFSKDAFSPSYFVSQKAGTDDWTVVLTQGTWLEGTVFDTDGTPIPNATVKAQRGPFQNPGVVIGEVTTETRTDANGVYRLHVEPDTYTVQTRVSGVGAVSYESIEVQEKEKKNLDIRLDAGVTLRATVRDSVTGRPVEGFMLWNWRQPDVEGVSDADGVLEISGLMEGELEFNVTTVGEDRGRSSVAGNYARWWSPEAVAEYQREEIPEGGGFQRNFDNLKFDLTGEEVPVTIFVEPLVTIRGRVLDPDGEPVPGATVAPAKTGSGNSITGDTRYSYETDEEGRFTMKLPASKNAEYNLVAHDGKYREWRRWANGVAEPIKTRPGQQIDGVELRLTKPATVRGTITDSLGRPRPNVKVRAAAFDRLDNRYYLPEAATDVNGDYTLKYVRPGKHFIQVEPYWLDAAQAPDGTSRTVEVEAEAIVEDVDFVSD